MSAAPKLNPPSLRPPSTTSHAGLHATIPSFAQPQKSEKSYGAMFALCFFLGTFGAHRFYAGKPITGILMFCTLGGLGLWALVDLLFIAFGSFKDGQGHPIRRS